MACELEQQTVDTAMGVLQAANAQRAIDVANLQQSDFAVMAAQMQLMMALMLLQNCLNGGGMFGMPQMLDLMSVSEHPEKLKAKVSELIESAKSKAVKAK